MAQAYGRKQREKFQGGMFFPLLAFVLLFLTLIGFFSKLSPETALSDAMEKTKKDLMGNDEVLLFVKDAFGKGEIRFSGKEGEVIHRADLPEGASLSFKKSKDEVTISSSKDQLTLTSSFSDQKYGADRMGASDLISDSAFSDAGISEEWLLLFRSYLALTEKGAFSEKVFSDAAQSIFSSASPALTVKKGENGEKEYLYEISHEGLALALSAFSEEGKNGEIRDALSAYLSLAASLFDEDISPEKKNECLLFLSGEGEGFDAFAKGLNINGSKGSISYTVKSDRLSSVEVLLVGDFAFRSKISFGEELKKDGGVSVLFELVEEKGRVFSLSFSQKITENSDSALIRNWSMQIEDPKHLFLSEKEESSADITFSWGKKKGDLGLRLTLDEKEIGFRGAVGEYRAGKKLSFTIKRIEIGKKNILSSPLEAQITTEGEIPAFKSGESALFPQGEEREKLSQVLKRSVSDLFLKKE